MKTKNIYPIPEILEDGRDWEIRDLKDQPHYVEHDTRSIYVPLRDDDCSHCIRLKQIGRMKWDDTSPDIETAVSEIAHDPIFSSINDYRIHHLLEKSGVDITPGFLPEEEWTKLMYANDVSTRLCGRLLTARTRQDLTGGCSFANHHTNEVLQKLFDHITTKITENPTTSTVLDLTNLVFKELKIEKTPKSNYEQIRSKRGRKFSSKNSNTANGSVSFEEGWDVGWDTAGEDQKLQNIPSSVRNELPTELSQLAQSLSRASTGCDYYFPPGEMQINEPARTIPATGRFHKKWKCTEEGAYPRYTHRFAVDQKVFAKRKKIPGGVVLIDASGSMAISPEQIKSIVLAAPGCVVAVYSGHTHSGVLRILAKDGMRVEDSFCRSPAGGSNVVDFPALLWAFKQNHPRIWVSDLIVTGQEDQMSVGMNGMCFSVMKKGRFFHANNCDEAVKILQRLGRFYKK